MFNRKHKWSELYVCVYPYSEWYKHDSPHKLKLLVHRKWKSSTPAASSSWETMQIDSFLEQFKRSASKAMDGDWTTTTTTHEASDIASTSATNAPSTSNPQPNIGAPNNIVAGQAVGPILGRSNSRNSIPEMAGKIDICTHICCSIYTTIVLSSIWVPMDYGPIRKSNWKIIQHL